MTVFANTTDGILHTQKLGNSALHFADPVCNCLWC